MLTILLLSLATPQNDAGAPPAADTDALSPALLTAHPGLENGRFDQVRDDWLTALEADRGSGLAAVAVARIAELDEWCTSGISPARLGALIEGVPDAEAQLGLRKLYLREMRRSRFSDDRPVLKQDLFQAFFAHWRVLDPWGALDHPSPMMAAAPADPTTLLQDEVASPDGRTLQWHALPRRGNELEVAPSARVVPEAGTTFVTTFVRAEPGRATLELHCDEDFRAWWNGGLVREELRSGLTDAETAFRNAILVEEGWNSLILQVPVEEDARIGARLLDTEGRYLASDEWNGDGWPEQAQRGDVFLALPVDRPDFGDEGYGAVLDMHAARIARRPDVALAAPAPAEDAPAALQGAWLHARHLALQDAFHLPQEEARRRMVTVEEELDAFGRRDPQVQFARFERMVDEDRPGEAAHASAALCAELEHCARLQWQRAEILRALDEEGVLAMPLLEELQQRFPFYAAPVLSSLEIAGEHGHRTRERQLARRALILDADADVFGDLFWLLLEGGRAGDHELLDQWTARWLAEEPASSSARWYRDQLLRHTGRHEAWVASAEEQLEEAPQLPRRHRELAERRLRDGDREGGLKAMREATSLRPGAHELRRMLAALDADADRARSFFAEFGPDVDAALARAREMENGSSTALALDHGMVYFLPDGSAQYRTHNVHVALDRAGTEKLHEQRAFEFTNVARVHDRDGTTFEPHRVDDSWVMPELDPGDAVEVQYDRYLDGLPGAATDVGSWRFASFEEPFALSRFVVFVPEGMPGELRDFHFEGSREEIPWEGGTVYVYEQRNSPRYESEVMQPSDEEILPWVAYGADRGLDRTAALWRDWTGWQSDVAADVDVELRAFVEEHATDSSPVGRAEQLYDAVTQRVIEFQGPGDTTDVWTLRRGNPIGLMAAAFERADVAFEWAAVTETAPELDPDPLRAFAGGDRFQVPALRLAPDSPEGEPTWVVLASRGTAFGSIPTEMMGAEALVLENGGGWREETLPRDGLARVWNLDFEVSYDLAEDGSATAAGSVSMTGAEGGALREQLAQLEPQQRQATSRQIAAGLVPGLDLQSAEFVDLDDAGSPFHMEFQGAIPEFVRESGDTFGARLRIPEMNISSGLGPAERNWPLAFRNHLRMRVHVRLNTNGLYTFAYGPDSRREERDGFAYHFSVNAGDQVLDVQRVLKIRGLQLAPESVPGFLALAGELEKQESRAVELFPVVEGETAGGNAGGGEGDANGAGDEATGDEDGDAGDEGGDD